MKFVNLDRTRRIALLFALTVSSALLAIGQAPAKGKAVIHLDVDAREAARNVLHVKESITVRPGAITLFYPKWIPGEHSPTGPINDMVNLFITVNGKPLAWDRDDVEMFAFHVTVPPGVDHLQVTFDDVSQPNTTASSQLARIKWNRLLVYPLGLASDNIQVKAKLTTPADWQYATALAVTTKAANTAEFEPVSLTAFIDSPAIIGRYLVKVPLTTEGVLHEMDIAADNEKALEYKPETLQAWKDLVKEAQLMYGARHYRSYRFLLTLSDAGGSEGLEHHESSEDGVGLASLSDPEGLADLGDLLGHEYTHSWNGKYRRPASLTTPDFDRPMHGDLLWVYEGLTQYLGYVLSARSHMWTPDVFRETVADTAATMQNQSGRKWRPLVDTARAVQFTYPSPTAWLNARRRVDYYFEGMMIWLEADVLIRQRTGGKKSLDDFLHEFHGGKDSAPMVKTYSLADVVASLNKVLPYDWNGFLRDRVYTVRPDAPFGGITGGGWRLVYTDQPNVRMAGVDRLRNRRNLMYSIGVFLDYDGYILDVNPDLPGAKAGLSPGMKIVRGDGKDLVLDDVLKQVADARGSTSPIQLTVEYGGTRRTFSLDYHGGLRYPHLERDASNPDTMSDIIKGH